jgi:hypothetical protein
MDVLFFLKERTRLIRLYFGSAAQPFNEIIRKIKAEEAPNIPPYSEDSEPAYLREWTEADELLEVTGRVCISMPAAALQFYFTTWENKLGQQCGMDFRAVFRRDGWLGGYRACLAERVGIDWDLCPANLDIIEQVVMARNRDQHPESITTVRVTHSAQDRQRHPRPFFMSEHETALLMENEELSRWLSPSLHVSRELLMQAIEEVECLCGWLEERLNAVRYSGLAPAER